MPDRCVRVHMLYSSRPFLPEATNKSHLTGNVTVDDFDPLMILLFFPLSCSQVFRVNYSFPSHYFNPKSTISTLSAEPIQRILLHLISVSHYHDHSNPHKEREREREREKEREKRTESTPDPKTPCSFRPETPLCPAAARSCTNRCSPTYPCIPSGPISSE